LAECDVLFWCEFLVTEEDDVVPEEGGVDVIELRVRERLRQIDAVDFGAEVGRERPYGDGLVGVSLRHRVSLLRDSMRPPRAGCNRRDYRCFSSSRNAPGDIGRENRKPWASSTPSHFMKSSISCVSMPSATTRKPRSFASLTQLTIAALANASCIARRVNAGSIFTSVNGNWRSRSILVVPAPKSSTARPKPRSRSVAIVAEACGP